MEQQALNQISDATKTVPGQPTEAGAALHSEIYPGKVGDYSSNQAWSQMTGAYQAGRDQASGTTSGAHSEAAPMQSISSGNDSKVYAQSGSDFASSDAPSGYMPLSENAQVSASSFSEAPNTNESQAQKVLNDGLSPASTTALYGGGIASGADGVSSSGPGGHGSYGAADYIAAGGTSSGAEYSHIARATDGVSDNVSVSAGSDASRPPEPKLPTPEQLASAPIGQLQSISNDYRQALNDYVQAQGDSIPTLALHGTSASSGHSLSSYSQRKGEIWVAGQNPSRRNLGANQFVGDLSVSAQTSIGYAEKRGQTAGNQPGPVLVYDASSQPQAWAKTNNFRQGSTIDGNSPEDQAKFGILDLSKAKLLGSVSPDQLDSLKQQFVPLTDALLAKQSDILSSPGSPSAAQKSDLLARVQVMYELNNMQQTRTILDVVSQSAASQ